jgi:hypothetical protein
VQIAWQQGTEVRSMRWEAGAPLAAQAGTASASR